MCRQKTPDSIVNVYWYSKKYNRNIQYNFNVHYVSKLITNIILKPYLTKTNEFSLIGTHQVLKICYVSETASKALRKRKSSTQPSDAHNSISTIYKSEGAISNTSSKLFGSKTEKSKRNIFKWLVKPFGSKYKDDYLDLRSSWGPSQISVTPGFSNDQNYETNMSQIKMNENKIEVKVPVPSKIDFDKNLNDKSISFILSAKPGNLGDKLGKNKRQKMENFDCNSQNSRSLSTVLSMENLDSIVINEPNDINEEIDDEKSVSNEINANQNSKSPTFKTKRKNSFLRKIVLNRRNKSTDANNSSPGCVSYYEDEQFMGQLTYSNSDISGSPRNIKDINKLKLKRNDKKSQNIKKDPTKIYTIPSPTTYVPLNLNSFSTPHNDALRFVRDLADKLQESENFIKNLLIKYISDHHVEKQLMEALEGYSKIQQNAERRANILTNDLYARQLETFNIQKNNLNQTVEALVKQNRTLQDENDALSRKVEKLNLRLKMSSEMKQSKRLFHRLSNIPPISQQLPVDSDDLDELSQNTTVSLNADNFAFRINDKLRSRLNSANAQINNLEHELTSLQRKEEDLINKVRDLQSQLEQQKITSHYLKLNNDVEITNLQHELYLKNKTLKETEEVAQILISDVELIKRLVNECPNLSIELDLRQFVNDTSIINLLHDCRIFINSLGFKIVESQHAIQITKKETSTLNKQINDLRKDLAIALSEYEKLSIDLEDLNKRSNEITMIKEKKSELRGELEVVHKKYLALSTEYENYKKRTDDCKNELLQKLTKQAFENQQMRQNLDETIKNSHLTKETTKCQLQELRNANESLNKALEALGGKSMSEKLAYFQEQCYQLSSEKNNLIEQIHGYNLERGTIVQYQSTYYEHLTQQRTDLERLNEQNQQLWQQVASQRDEIVSLEFQKAQLERQTQNCEITEKTLQRETARAKELEEAMLKMTIEINQLTLVANYNQQIAENYQIVIHEKDAIITNLESKLTELQNQCISDVKEKVALCTEVSKLSDQSKCLKDALQEQRNSVDIFENKTKEEMKKVEQSRSTERKSLIELSKEYQKLVSERDHLLVINEQLTAQIEQVKNSEADTKHFCQQLGTECVNLVERIKELDKTLNEVNIRLQYTDSAKQLEEKRASHGEQIIQTLKKEYSELETEHKNVLCSLKKQNDDIANNSKVNQETLTTLENEKKKVLQLESEREKLHKQIDSITTENLYLKAKTNDSLTKIEHLELEKVNILENYSRSNEELNDLLKENETLKAEIKHFENECKILSDKNETLLNQSDITLTKKSESYLKQIEELTNENEDLKYRIQNLELKSKALEELKGEECPTPLMNQIESVTTKNEMLMNKIQNLELKCENFEREKLLRETKTLHSESEMKFNIEKLRRENNTKDSKIRELISVSDFKYNICKDLQVDDYSEEISQLMKAYKEMTEALIEANIKIANYQEELEKLNQERVENEKTIADFKHTTETLLQEIDELKEFTPSDNNYSKLSIRDIRHSKQSSERGTNQESIRSQEINKEVNQLKGTHSDLPHQLLGAVSMLIDERISRQNIEKKLLEISSINNVLKQQSEDMDSKATISRTRILELVEENQKLKSDLHHAQISIREAIEKNKENENEVLKYKKKLKLLEKDTERSMSLIEEQLNIEELTLRDNVSKIALLESQQIKMKQMLNEKHENNLQLQKLMIDLETRLAKVEFEKKQLGIKLHEIELSLKTEQTLKEQLCSKIEKVITKLKEMEKTSAISSQISDVIFKILQHTF